MNDLENAKVSVVLPCYNQINYVHEAIDSVLNQSYKNLELILVDNKSTDGTKEVLSKYAEKDKRVKCIFHERNLGFTKSINDGFAAATGELVAIHNSDDVWHANKLEMQAGVFENHPEVDVVSCDAEIIDQHGRSKGYSFCKEIKWKTFGLLENAFEELCKRNFCCHPSIIFRKSCFSTVKEYDEALSYSCDWWFLLLLSKKHKFYYLKDKLLSYRVHPTNLTKDKSNTYRDMREMRKRIAELGVDRSLNYAKAALYASMLREDAHAKEFAKKSLKDELPLQYKLAMKLILSSDHAGSLISKLSLLRNLSREAVRKIF